MQHEANLNSDHEADLDSEDLGFTSQVAHALDRSPATVRNYERRGLLHPKRTSSGVRLFSMREVAALARRLKKQESLLPPPLSDRNTTTNS
jgi:hypothetical protein